MQTTPIWILTILFVALKLTDKINWSWLWVLSPLWISFLFGIITLVAVLAYGTRQVKKIDQRNRRTGKYLK